MFNIKSFFTLPYGYYDYIWVDVLLIKETQKAVLVEFDGRRAWFPKAWIAKIRRSKKNNSAKINISLYNWSKEFS